MSNIIVLKSFRLCATSFFVSQQVERADSVGCYLGCLLLSDIHINRPGECPIPSVPGIAEGTSLFRLHQIFCRKLCDNDASCPHPLQKCCTFGCIRNCTTVRVATLLEEGREGVKMRAAFFSERR
ncbi:unnamed protein product [Hydatigera taeniaeformis]|uniref:WAP domain-containing protein n=1 Tax=Hydatigena taeniaeformis TaxID=6205 RepID=A0A0R3WXV7_HYDTA|nr:unnamed protein product [Hydatigera taeniaeformis]